jgi:hypothetical protein
MRKRTAVDIGALIMDQRSKHVRMRRSSRNLVRNAEARLSKEILGASGRTHIAILIGKLNNLHLKMEAANET